MSQFSLNSWIISDTHFGHDNIVKYCDRPANHDFVIADNWRRMVYPKQRILHLGDLTVWFGLKQETWESVASQLPGKKFLIRGNHDERTDEEYAAMGYRMIEPFIAKMGVVRVLFTHEPVWFPSNDWDINVHGHVHNNNHRDGDYLPSWCRNVSIEMTNYRPIHIGDALSVQTKETEAARSAS